MVRKNCKEKQNLACAQPVETKDKRKCECCGRPVCNFRTCGATRNGSICGQEISTDCKIGDYEESSYKSSSTSCKKEKSCVRSIEQVCKEFTTKKCKRNSDICQDDIRANICKNSQDSCPRDSTNKNNICKNDSSEKTRTDHEDVCPKENPCKMFGCIEIDEAGICMNVPSVMQHIEECKKKFLGIIEASLCNIGKNNDPEKIIRTTLYEAHRRKRLRLLEGKTADSNVSEGSSDVQEEAENLKKFCRNDLLAAAYQKLVSCGGYLEPEVCGPCGINNAVPCLKTDHTVCGQVEPEVCGPCGINNAVPCLKTDNTVCGQVEPEVCGPRCIRNAVPCLKTDNTVCGQMRLEVCGPCGIRNAVPCLKTDHTVCGQVEPEVCGPCGIRNAVPCLKTDNTVCGQMEPEVCGPCGVKNAVPCLGTNNAVKKHKKCRSNAQGDYKDEEISEFVKIIDRKLREELTRKLKTNICAEDSVALKNSYYCVATLCPCMTKSYSLKGPLVLGPFNFGPQEEQTNVCCKQSEETESVCGSSDTVESFHYSQCIADSDSVDSDSSNSVSVCSDGVCTTKIRCNRAELVKKSEKCTVRSPVVLEHHDSYVYCPDRRAEEHLNKAYSKKSEAVAKWGKCYDLVDSVLYERDERMQICKEFDLQKKSPKETNEHICKRDNGNEEEYLLTHVCGVDERCVPKLQACKREDDDVCQNICSRPSHTCRVGNDNVCITGDDFDNLDRFHDIGSYGFAKLCRKLFKWLNCISKNWKDLRSNPHIVVHLPSLSFCRELRCRASKTFDYLQNTQVGRIGWLEDPNVQVIYVFPTPQTDELLAILQDLVTTVRPDIDISKRLWLIRPDPKCIMKKCVSGSANLFYSPEMYRRVRYLTAGRHAVILPGLMDQKDVFIGCELKIPIMGPPMKFQKRLLSKSYVMELLDVNKIQHPPFLHVHSFGQLCRGMAIMAAQHYMYKTWFVKIDNGFNGHHTGIIRFQKGILGCAIRNIERTGCINEDYLCKLLAETLPLQLQLQKSVYKCQKEFFRDLEQYGGIIQACPNNCYHVVSVGVFIEHDLAKPVFVTAGEVIHFGKDIRNDMAYFLPQNKISQDSLDELVDTIGTLLRNEHVVGYFGIDIVIFRDEFDVQQFWVIDVDPYYTDLIAFSDWVNFCVGSPEDSKSKSGNSNETLIKLERHAICSGKLFGTGLSKYCGSMLMTLCKQNQIFYNNQEKMGCMVYPTDSHNRALNIVSINTTRLLTMKKFIEAMKVLNQLALRNNGNETFTDTTCFSNYLK